MYRLTIALTFFVILMACEHSANKPEVVVAPTPTATPVVEVTSRTELAWEKNHPERKPWSDFLMEQAIENENFFFMAKDITEFCPRYNKLARTKRAQVVSEIVVAMSFYESGWKPNTYFPEPQSHFTKPDPVTGKPVASEGLLQLSYQDTRFSAYKDFCKFDYKADRLAIQSPIANLRCGFGIFLHLVKQNKVISSQYVLDGKTKYEGAARYWSVIRKQNHKQDIINRVRNAMKECST